MSGLNIKQNKWDGFIKESDLDSSGNVIFYWFILKISYSAFLDSLMNSIDEQIFNNWNIYFYYIFL